VLSDEDGQQIADGGSLAGSFGQRQVFLDLVAVAAAVFVLDDVPGCGQVGDDAVGAALGAARAGRDVASRTPGSRAMRSSTRARLVRTLQLATRRMLAISRNLLLVCYCECRLRADTRDQPPTAARVPRGHRREPPMVLTGPAVIVAALMVIAVPRIIRRQV